MSQKKSLTPYALFTIAAVIFCMVLIALTYFMWPTVPAVFKLALIVPAEVLAGLGVRPVYRTDLSRTWELTG
jgi:hypothetical protein